MTRFQPWSIYVALSKGVSQNSTKVLIKVRKIQEEDGNFTKNVVFKDFFYRSHMIFPLHNKSFIHLCYRFTNYY
jgi:hypothetical protein